MKYHILLVVGCVEPELSEPFGTHEARDAEARRLKNEVSDEDGIFWLDVDDEGEVKTGAFTYDFFEEEEEDEEEEDVEISVSVNLGMAINIAMSEEEFNALPEDKRNEIVAEHAANWLHNASHDSDIMTGVQEALDNAEVIEEREIG